MKNRSVSLMISTYNWPQALELTLLSALRQSIQPAEIVIADDGSKEETAELVRRYAAQSPIPIVHVWQEDTGFRLAAIRNKAIAACRHDYIVQVDGDVILHRHFIRDHIRRAEPGYMVSGSRVLVGQKLSTRLFQEKKTGIGFFTPGLGNRINGLYCPLIAGWLKNSSPDKYKGCNMAYWRNDMIRINGYDEQIEGWGCEDFEMATRMKNTGIRKHTMKFAGIVYHLYHKEASRSNEDRNREIQSKSAEERRIRCEKGINQYLRKE